MNLSEMANFMEKCGPGWEKELKNFNDFANGFNEQLSKKTTDFPYSKVFWFLNDKGLTFNTVTEDKVTLKTFSEDIQLQFSKLEYEIEYKQGFKKSSIYNAFMSTIHISRTWGNVELNLFLNKGNLYWCFCKLRPNNLSRRVLCCENKKRLYDFLNNWIPDGLVYHDILGSTEIL